MTEPPALCGSEGCITCGDEGHEMTVLSLDAGDGLAWCSADHATAADPELVQVSLVAALVPGDRILVHAGTAIASLRSAGESS